MRYFLIFAGCLVPAASLHAAPKPAPRPNVLMILADDLGFADTSFQGSKSIPTPHLDRLAQSGVRCTNGYVSHPFCSPTRAGLLTGRYQQRFGHYFNPVYDPLDPSEGLPLSERLLPQFMQEAGWKTGWIGKWHLGSSPAQTPQRRGFEETFGFIGGGHRYLGWTANQRQYTLPIERNGKPAPVEGHLTTAFGHEAADFVRRRRQQPWFLYLAFNALHTPHEPTPDRLSRFASLDAKNRRAYAAQISLLDDAVGEVLATLKDSGQQSRTLVFFFSDNGGPVNAGASNDPLRGQKGDVYEGGIRVPFVVSWPGVLPAGKSYDEPVISLDVFATALGVAGIPMPQDRPYDGVNLVPHLSGESKQPPHQSLFWQTGAGDSACLAVREGAWKLVRNRKQPAELYNLAADVGEKKNLADEQPEVATRLSANLENWNKQLAPPAFLGSSAKNEDWGPGGANQRNNPNSRRAAGKNRTSQP